MIVRTNVNGILVEQQVEPRLLLSDFLRHTLANRHARRM
jgi:aerobic-type carbon monoxide dehydrogenase small subunit (CoxS/CutS family)